MGLGGGCGWGVVTHWTGVVVNWADEVTAIVELGTAGIENFEFLHREVFKTLSLSTF